MVESFKWNDMIYIGCFILVCVVVEVFKVFGMIVKGFVKIMKELIMFYFDVIL